MKSVIFVLFLLTCCQSTFSQIGESRQTSACDPGNLNEMAPNDFKEVGQFLQKLQLALAKNDRQRVANLIRYPLQASTQNGKTLVVNSRKQFIRSYDTIFHPELKKLIAQQSAECINRMGSKGFMIARGEIWFVEAPDGKLLITTTNPVLLIPKTAAPR